MKRRASWILVFVTACSPASTPPPGAIQARPSTQVRGKDEPQTRASSPATTALGPPVLTDTIRSLPTLPWETYRKIADSSEFTTTLEEQPAEAGPAWFGLNLFINRENRSYVLIPREGEQWSLYVDHDGDGAVDLGGAGWRLSETFSRRTVGTEPGAYEAAFRVLLKDDGSPRLEAQTSSKRTGELQLDAHAYAVELVGRAATYNLAGATLRVDVDRDGKFDPDPLASESFDVANNNAYVSLEALHLGFNIAADGQNISWKPRRDVLGPRPPVGVGASAPPFPSGLTQRDAQPQPPFVLEFFSPGCEFCKEAAPGFARATLGPLREAGIAVVSVEQDNSGEGQTYAESMGKTWRVVTDADGKSVSELYRVRAVPTYIVVGADGAICARGNWRSLAEALTAGKPCESKPNP